MSDDNNAANGARDHAADGGEADSGNPTLALARRAVDSIFRSRSPVARSLITLVTVVLLIPFGGWLATLVSQPAAIVVGNSLAWTGLWWSHPTGDKFSVLVVNVVGEESDVAFRKALADSISGRLGADAVHVWTANATLRVPETGDSRENYDTVLADAESWRAHAHADVIVWVSREFGNKIQVHIQTSAGESHREGYSLRLDSGQGLPDVFADEIDAEIVHMVSQLSDPAYRQHGEFLISRLTPFVGRLKAMVDGIDDGMTPADQAWRYNSYGLVILVLGEQQGDLGEINNAIQSFQHVAAIETTLRNALGVAQAQTNLAAAWEALCENGQYDQGSLAQAITANKDAAAVFKSQNMLALWASTQTDLGNVLRVIGQHTHDLSYFDKADAAYTLALTYRTQRPGTVVEWADTINNYANMLETRGEFETGVDSFQRAIKLYQSALPVRAQAGTTVAWAETEHGLGIAQMRMGERLGSEGLLRQALAAFHQAQTVRTQNDMKVAWATTEMGVGYAETGIGQRTHKLQDFVAAKAAYQSAIAVFQNADSTDLLTYAQEGLKDTQGAAAAMGLHLT